MTPFTIQCTTCRRSLRVVEPEAIGQILSCPKCGSMVLVEPPAGIDAAGCSAALASESTSSPAVKMTAATVTESSKSLSSSAGSSVEEVSEAASSGGPIDSDAPTMLVADTTQEAAVGGRAAPIVALAIAEEIPAEYLPAANRWPHWFLPGAILALAAGFLVFAVRMMAPSREPVPANVSVSERITAAPADAAAATEQPASNSVVETAVDQQAVDDPAAAVTARSEEPAPVAPPARVEAQPQGESQSQTVAPSAMVERAADEVPTVKNQVAKETPARSVPESTKVPPPPEPTAPAGALHTRTLQRVAPRQVDVDARLMDPLSGIEVRDMPLWAYLDLVSELSSIPITLDAQAVTELGQSAAAPVHVKLGQTPVAGALEAALDPLRLGYQVRDGQLIVGYPPQEEMRQVRYAVGDLSDGNPDAPGLAELGALVRRMVAPDSWQPGRAEGGKASMVAGGDALLVGQYDPAHLAILIFCEKLRVARDKAIKSKFDPARFVLTTHLDQAHETLTRPVTANFGAPQPLSSVVNWLRAKTGVTLVVDHAALALQGISADSECTVVADGKPLSVVLDELLAPLDLAWRTIDEKTIEITTTQAAAERMDVEFYPVRDLAADAPAGHSVVSRLVANVDPKVWGDDSAKAAIHFDLPGRTLIVRAPQKVQAQVESFLTSQRKRK